MNYLIKMISTSMMLLLEQKHHYELALKIRSQPRQMKKLLESAAKYIEKNRIEAACSILPFAYKRCDGQLRPQDFVMGEATPELATMIQDLKIKLGCEWPKK